MSTLEGTEDTLFNRTFRDSDGNIVIAQMPNLPILIWLAATLLELLDHQWQPPQRSRCTGFWLPVHLGVVRTVSGR